MIHISLRGYTLAVAIFLVLSALGGWFGEVYVPSLMLAGDAATTAAQLRQHDQLFRLGFAAYLVEAFSDVVLAWLFYVLLKPVHRDLALLSAFFGLVATLMFAVAKLLYFAAPTFLGGSRYLTAFPAEQADSLAASFLSLYAGLHGVSLLFYGTGWILRGWLAFRSTFLPRWLGALMAVAGLGFAATTVTQLLAPAWSTGLLLAPMALNALAVAIWMLVKGVDGDQWNRAAAAAP